MKARAKETYFVFGIIIVFLLGFIIGGYLTSDACQKHSRDTISYLEECNYDRMAYLDICGEINYLIDNKDIQNCINTCHELP